MFNRELAWDELPDPGPARSAHARRPLAATVGRRQDTSGRTDEDGVRCSRCRSEQAPRDKLGELLKFVNWDTRLSRMIHYERACRSCSSRVEAGGAQCVCGIG